MFATVALFALIAFTGFSEGRIDPCGMPIESGNCLAYFPSWGYDKNTGECVEFVYGGCGGNLNRFESKEKCNQACANRSPCHLPLQRGFCRAIIPRWGYDRAAGRCRRFFYGGCGGNENNFETEEQCRMVCDA